MLFSVIFQVIPKLYYKHNGQYSFTSIFAVESFHKKLSDNRIKYTCERLCEYVDAMELRSVLNLYSSL